MLKITLGTNNKHKIDEINLIAKEYGIEFVPTDKFFNPVENGNTFLKNAYCKADCARKHGKTKLFLADDSGLCIEALNGAPGIYSARYADTPKARIERVLEELKGIENRNAKFVCAMVLVNQEGEIVFQVQKDCPGEILHEEKGHNGFGYDPIFLVKGLNKSMAELSDFEKSKISHRGLAIKDILEFLKNFEI